MKQTLQIMTLLAFSGLSSFTNAQDFQWAKQMGGSTNDAGYALTIDADGSVYSTGSFSGTADFDPGAGTSNLMATGGTDIYISKLDASGNLLWAKQIGGSNSDEGNTIKLDGMGNVYIAGYFQGTSDFDTGLGTTNLTSLGDSDIFILKLDNAGNFVWVKQIGGINLDNVYSMNVGVSGNLCAIGSFSGTVDFDSGSGTSNLTAAGSDDIFILKLDASGNFAWAKNIGASGNDYGSAIAVDGSANVYASGSFQGTVDFDSGSGTSNLSSASSDDVFLLKLDASGNFVWAKGLGGIGEGVSLACDISGNVYLGSYFIGTADFDPNAGTFNLSSVGGSVDIAVSKLDASGNLVWAKKIGGNGSEYAPRIALDLAGNVYVSGTFSATADFDPSSGTLNLTSAGSQDIFIAELSYSGNLLWAKAIGSSGTDYASLIALDAAGAIYTTGAFSGTANFDSGTGTNNLTSAGALDAFVMKWAAPTVGVEVHALENSLFTVYPNPGNGVVYINSENELAELVIMNSLGEFVYSSTLNSINPSLDLSTQPKGIYFVKLITSEGKVATKKLLLVD